MCFQEMEGESPTLLFIKTFYKPGNHIKTGKNIYKLPCHLHVKPGYRGRGRQGPCIHCNPSERKHPLNSCISTNTRIASIPSCPCCVLVLFHLGPPAALFPLAVGLFPVSPHWLGINTACMQQDLFASAFIRSS